MKKHSLLCLVALVAVLLLLLGTTVSAADSTPVLGDVNGDSVVNSDDAILLLRYTLLPETYPINQPADFDQSGAVDSNDAIYLLRHTLLPSTYPLVPFEHNDGDNDHLCDCGCGTVFGVCEDANLDHECDYGCDKPFGEHADTSEDNDHLCDYGCNAVLEACFDAANDNDHRCDVCGLGGVTECAFEAATCAAPATCAECGATTGSTLAHQDSNHDHACDNGCGKNDMGIHADSDTDADHLCDYGCGTVLEACADSDADTDHACDVCGVADVTAHTYVENEALAIAATCSTAATKTYECNCGDTYTENGGDALGHDVTGVTPEEQPISGCTYVLTYACRRNGCGETVQGETVNKHVYVASISTPATCSASGEKTFRCSACGDTSKAPEEIPADATGHNWILGDVSGGARKDTCSVCEKTRQVVVSDGNTASSNAADLANTDVQLKVDDETNANIQLSQGVADTIGDREITISAGIVDEDTLKDLGVSEEQLEQIGANTVYDFNINDENGAPISDFGENNFITITLPYALSDGEDVDSIAVWFIGDNCQVETCDKGADCTDAHKLVAIEATYNNGFVTFQTNHFSIYTVTRLTPAERCALYGHGYAEQTMEGSCTKDGYVLMVCERCHDKKIKEGTLIEADGHDYTVEIQGVTCTQSGYDVYTCSACGHSYKVKHNAIGHAWSVASTADATCMADGHTTYRCANCNETYTITSPKVPHVYTDTVVPATCTSDGYTLHDCDNCDYSYTDNFVPTIGHDFGNGTWTWEANGNKATLHLVCSHDASHAIELRVTSGIEKVVEKGECSNYVIRTHTATVEYNGVTYTDVFVIRQGNPKHKFPDEWSQNDDGHWRECICGAKTDEAAHVFENATVTKNATCTEDGESTAYCVCGAINVTTIPANGHSFGEWIVTKDPTEATEGEKRRDCANCDVYETDVIAALTHDHSRWDVITLDAVAPTCTTSGLTEGTKCSGCGEILLAQQPIAALGHTEVIDAAVAPTCTEAGLTEGKHCDVCGEVLAVQMATPANGHSFGEWVVTKDPSETATGEKRRDCANCDAYETDIVAELTHDHSRWDVITLDAVAPTCTTSGLTEGTKCSSCGETLLAQQPIAALGHTNKVLPAIAPTCTTVGFAEGKRCTVCDAITVAQKLVPALGHTEVIDAAVAPTCIQTGLTGGKHCEVCGTVFAAQQEIPATGEHIYTDGFCEFCGKNQIDCTHELVPQVIDLGDLGACDWTLVYYACECGQVKELDIDQLEESYDCQVPVREEVSTDENGNTVVLTIGNCTCGLEFLGTTTITQDKCTTTYSGTATFHFNGVLLLEAPWSWADSDHGNTAPKDVDLSEYGACGGVLTLIVCEDCGECIGTDDFYADCLDSADVTEEEFVLEDGTVQTILSISCPICGLSVVWEEIECHPTPCITVYTDTVTISCGETVIYTISMPYSFTRHNYVDESYELVGETCFDGVYVTRRCTECGDSSSRYSESHANEEYTEIDLSAYNVCGGGLEICRCTVCEAVIDFDYHLNCDGFYTDYQPIFDENGVEIGHVTTNYCPDCELTLIFRYWEEAGEACSVTVYHEQSLFCGETCIVQSMDKQIFLNHTCEYTYETESGNCEDQYKVIEHCTVCGKTWEWWTSGHAYEYVEIDLADYNCCGGSVEIEQCAICGATHFNQFIWIACEWESVTTEEIVDENGITHVITTYFCATCGTSFVEEEYTEETDVCEFRDHYLLTISAETGTIICATGNTRDYVEHQFAYSYEMLGDTCEEGYRATGYCTRCGTSDTYEAYGHNLQWRSIDLSERGLCGGTLEENFCSICGTVTNSGFYGLSCDWWVVEANDTSFTDQCSVCGVLRTETTFIGEKDENCRYTRIVDTVFTLNGDVVLSSRSEGWGTNHRYQYGFEMNGTSCTDGYTVIETCKDCDLYDSWTESSHDLYPQFKSNENSAFCDSHNVTLLVCPCGDKYKYGFNDKSFVYDEQSNRYTCETCGLTVAYNADETEQGCALVRMNTLWVAAAGEMLYRYANEQSLVYHSFTDVETHVADGVIYLSTICDKCGEMRSTEILQAVLEEHNDGFYYDYTFIPTKTGSYTILGHADADTFVTLYELRGGKPIKIDYNDDGGTGSQFLLTKNLTAGTTYVYRIRFYDASKSGTISFSLSSDYDDHPNQHGALNATTWFAALTEGAESCEDGVLFGEIYSACGHVRYTQTEYGHVRTEEIVDLTEYGACDGILVIAPCVCGQYTDVVYKGACTNAYTHNQYYDEQGRLIYVQVSACSTCDLRRTVSYYAEKVPGSCKVTRYYTEVFTIGNTLIAESEYTGNASQHDTLSTAVLMGGEGSTCNDGVLITETCKNCDYEYSYNRYYHYSFQKERIDLAETGSVCGGYAIVYGCACGYSSWMDLSDGLCDLGSENCAIWIEDVITGNQFTTNGWYYYSHSAYLYTCAVTDPADAACAYKIRYASYWQKDEDACMAYRYETWQFGYDEQTGACLYEVTYRYGNGRPYHNYVDSSEDGNEKFDCPDCGSYYNRNYYYDESGKGLIKMEELAYNTQDNGYNKYYECVYEYTQDSGYKRTTTYTDSDGESYRREEEYVYYKNYTFIIYDHLAKGDYWDRRDYTYTFDPENGCVRTETYTDSNGANNTSVSNVCRSYATVTLKAPTCSQDGQCQDSCVVCGKVSEPYTVSPNDHAWVQITDEWCYCNACGLQNANGVSGSIIMEDLTEQYGNGEYYVVGYHALNDVTFSKYVALLLEDGREIIVPNVEFVAIDGLRAFAFRKAAIDAWATENGYTDYVVKFSFVPDGADGSFDYGITFADAVSVPDAIVDSVSFIDYIGAGETKRYTITPTKDSIWIFTSRSGGDTFAELYDVNGNLLTYDDDGGYNANFLIPYKMKAGETVVIEVRWLNNSYAGQMALLFTRETANP